MSTIDGEEIEEVTIDGDPVEEITRDGEVVWTAEKLVDGFEHNSVIDYYEIYDLNQANLPSASTTAAYEETYGGLLPSSNPNRIVSLPGDHPNYSSGTQPEILDHYPGPNTVLEFFWQPRTFSADGLYRILLNPEDYDHSQGCIRILIDGTGYWRIERATTSSTGWDYYGTDPQEGTWSYDLNSWHRIVVDMSIWPDLSAHVWNAETGEFKASLETSGGGGNLDSHGIGTWWNGETGVYVDSYRLIDADDYTTGQNL